MGTNTKRGDGEVSIVNRLSEQRWSVRFLALIAAVGLVAAACGGSSDNGKGSSSTTAVANVPNGGTLVIGAEQEPDVADWMDANAGSSWGLWMMGSQTMPRAFDFVNENGDWVYKPSILLDGEPTLQTGPPQVVTYKINPAAKWSDGVPITSSDF
jgi:peptide/nickel transport system substrate-binding protein